MAPITTRAGQPTTLEIAQAIERMRNLLHREYGADYGFVVMARGATLAQSLHLGVVEAVTK